MDVSPSTSPSEPAYRRLLSTDRQCWVCFATEEDEPGAEWTSPCRCRGGTKWVHQICLQQWIDEKQKMASSVVVSCPQCQFPYQVKYPSTNVFLLMYEYMERGISFCSPMILAGVTATALYWCSFTYGLTSAVLAMGKEESLEYFSHSNESSVVVVLLPLLPWVIFAVKFSRPEVLILKAWYRFLAPLMALAFKPLAIGTYSYFPTQRSFPSSQINIVHHLSRCVLSTVFLPLIASAIGHVLFSPVKGNLKKTLMGGAAYLLVTQGIKVVLEYYRYRYLQCRRGRPVSSGP